MTSPNTERKAKNKMCGEVYINWGKGKQTKSKQRIKILKKYFIIADPPDNSPSQGDN